MSRSKKDKKGGHKDFNYGKENAVVRAIFRRKRRQEGKRFVKDHENERKEPKPQKSSGGWFTWVILAIALTAGYVPDAGRGNQTQTSRIHAGLQIS